jgi:hypothetical protein
MNSKSGGVEWISYLSEGVGGAWKVHSVHPCCEICRLLSQRHLNAVVRAGLAACAPIPGAAVQLVDRE